RYYNLSFHNKKPEHEKDIWIPVLWHMREKFGREFTDNVMAFALKLVRDDPREEQDMTFNIYFSRKIKAADAILDNDGQKLQVIDEILSSSELKMDTTLCPKLCPAAMRIRIRIPKPSLFRTHKVLKRCSARARGSPRPAALPGGTLAEQSPALLQ